jgi:hypothetical protein
LRRRIFFIREFCTIPSAAFESSIVEDRPWPRDCFAVERLTPRAVHDQRTQSTYLFGAVCPERGIGATLVLHLADQGADDALLEPRIGRRSRPERMIF